MILQFKKKIILLLTFKKYNEKNLLIKEFFYKFFLLYLEIKI